MEIPLIKIKGMARRIFPCPDCGGNYYIKESDYISEIADKDQEIRVNFCQKLFCINYITHNMTTDCSLNYNVNT